jgi:hypothetical protein
MRLLLQNVAWDCGLGQEELLGCCPCEQILFLTAGVFEQQRINQLKNLSAKRSHCICSKQVYKHTGSSIIMSFHLKFIFCLLRSTELLGVSHFLAICSI